ncbi:transglutaminase family protein [uncultured Tenacibaculum sp.]|uniref:transglutaminase-like domain-containing protein n=1 Tax=uncultured Tenacibaculum sp. TaxID=174713 RepID=UPI00260AE834|nr:transglutaminase family protein [uncultured Tenacibaculum sp.]
MENTYLQSSFYLDYENPIIQDIVANFRYLNSEQEKIEQLYLFVRDNWRYNAYNIGLTANHFKASTIAKKKDGHCVDKSILYITCLRALNIPARLRLAKVSNHIAIEELIEKLGSNEIAPHGLTEVFYNGNWVKCSPAFNKELCDKFQVDVLDFNGSEDSVFQEFNNKDQKFMTYLEDYGSFEDVPLDFIKKTFQDNYPKLYEEFKNQSNISI